MKKYFVYCSILAVYEVNFFSTQVMMSFLQENKMKPEAPSINMGQWASQKMKVKSSVITQKKNCHQVPQNGHRGIIGHRGQTIQEILEETGVSVEMPPPHVQSVTITLRGEQALILFYSKANRVETIFLHLDVPSWLHKYIIGTNIANTIKDTIQYHPKVEVTFMDESVKIEGPPGEVFEACERLQERIDDLRKSVYHEEIKVNPAFHCDVIRKIEAYIKRLKKDTETLISIPTDSDSDVICIAGPPEVVAQVKEELLEMVHKMENEVTKDLFIEQRFHRTIIGDKGKGKRKIRGKFNQVKISFPKLNVTSDKITICGPKSDVEDCYEYLDSLKKEITKYSDGDIIHNEIHKFIFGKDGENIKKVLEREKAPVNKTTKKKAHSKN